MSSQALLACGCPAASASKRVAGAFVVRRSEYVPSCRLGSHAHEDARIVLTLRGALESRYGSSNYALDATRAIFRPARIEHRDEYPERTQCLSIVLPSIDDLPAHVYACDDPAFSEFSARLNEEYGAHDSAAPLVIEALCAQLAARFQCHARLERTGSWLTRLRARLDEQFRDPPSLGELSAEAGRERTHVAASFRRRYGVTIGDYVRSVRLWHARRALDRQASPLAEIAAEHGYTDQSHFARHFRSLFGISPGDYRKRRATLSS